MTLGVDLDKPVGPIRRKIIDFIVSWMAFGNLMPLCIKPQLKVLTDVNYKYYLGDDYKKSYKDPAKNGGKVSTIICNHSSPSDISVLLSVLNGYLSFVAGNHTLAMPGVGRIVRAIGCITMPMGGAEHQK